MKNNLPIIIIGAGIAGLAAAQTLRDNDIAVVVLEARDRVGGRIWVDHSLGMPLGKGATWIHSMKNNPLSKLAAKQGIPIVPFEMKKFYLYDTNKKKISRHAIQQFNNKFERDLENAKNFAEQLSNDIPLSDALFPFIMGNELSENEALFQSKLKFFENYVGAEYQLLSAKYWNEDPIDEEQGILIDAYEKIIFELSRKVEVKLNTIVYEVYRHADQVEIITNQGHFYASKVIVTVPLGVLKNQAIQFYPALSGQKQEAIHKLEMGLFNIIAMKFPNNFWPEDCHAFLLPNSSVCSMFLNTQRYTHSPILMGYFGGKKGMLLEKESDEVLLEKSVQQLKEFFGNEVHYPEKYYITRWAQDPFTLGSYSYLPVGATPEDREMLAQAEYNCYFLQERQQIKIRLLR